jgi:hypothetical protein
VYPFGICRRSNPIPTRMAQETDMRT